MTGTSHLFLTPFQVPSFRAIIEDPSFLKFCVFRNPFERLLSAFLDKVQQKIADTTSIRQTLGVDAQHDLSFEEFIYGVSHQEYSEMDPHWRIQYLQSFAFAVPGMKIHSLSNLKGLAEDLVAHTGIEGIEITTVSPHSTSAIERLPKFLSWDLAQMIKRKFSLDFDWAKTLGFEVPAALAHCLPAMPGQLVEPLTAFFPVPADGEPVGGARNID